jgi:hypothetical protein
MVPTSLLAAFTGVYQSLINFQMNEASVAGQHQQVRSNFVIVVIPVISNRRGVRNSPNQPRGYHVFPKFQLLTEAESPK